LPVRRATTRTIHLARLSPNDRSAGTSATSRIETQRLANHPEFAAVIDTAARGDGTAVAPERLERIENTGAESLLRQLQDSRKRPAAAVAAFTDRAAQSEARE